MLDSQGKVFVYQGPQSDPFEKNKAAAVAQAPPLPTSPPDHMSNLSAG